MLPSEEWRSMGEIGWLTDEEAVAMIMRELKCSREKAIELRDQFKRENPDEIIRALVLTNPNAETPM